MRTTQKMSFQNKKFDPKKYAKMLTTFGNKNLTKQRAVTQINPEVDAAFKEDLDECDLGEDQDKQDEVKEKLIESQRNQSEPFENTLRSMNNSNRMPDSNTVSVVNIDNSRE